MITNTSGDTGSGHSKEKRPAEIRYLSAVTSPRDSVSGESSDVRDSSEMGGRGFASPEGAKLVVGRINHIKMAIHTETGT